MAIQKYLHFSLLFNQPLLYISVHARHYIASHQFNTGLCMRFENTLYTNEKPMLQMYKIAAYKENAVYSTGPQCYF